MRFLSIIVLSISSFLTGDDILTISEKNTLKTQAKDAYKAKNYRKAISHYTELIDSFEVKDPIIYLDLAHAYYATQNYDTASQFYTQASEQASKPVQSIAFQQLGQLILAKDSIVLVKGDYENTTPEQISTVKRAANLYKESLIADYTNSSARHNYEAVKKWLDNIPEKQKKEQEKHEEQQKQEQEKKQQEEQQQKSEEQQKDQGDKGEKNDQQNDKGEKKDQQGEDEKQDKDQQGEKDNSDQEKKDSQNGEKKDNKGQEGKEGEKSDKEDGEGQQNAQKDKSEEQNEQQKGNAQEKEGEKKDGEKNEANQLTPEQKKAQEKAQQQQLTQQRLKENNFTKDKALQLLNSFDQQEKKYLQQMERKKPRRSNSSDKPDW